MHQLLSGQIHPQSSKMPPLAVTLQMCSVLIEASYHLTDD
jgi:hypothetical protein